MTGHDYMMTKIRLNNLVRDIRRTAEAGKPVTDVLQKEYRMLLETVQEAGPRCSACGGKLEADVLLERIGETDVQVCEDCGGLHMTAPRDRVCEFVQLDRPLVNLEPEGEGRYFDVTLTDQGDRRVHGWMDSITRRVLQIG